MADDNGLTISDNFYTVVAQNAARYRGETVVIKFGGELVEKEHVLRNLLKQAITLKNFGARVVLIHGGGKQIDSELEKAGIEPKKIDGRRDTDFPTLDVTHRCLNELNRQIVNYFHEEGSRLGANVAAVGLGGNDNRLITAVPFKDGSDTRTGRIESVDTVKLAHLADQNTVPILHPICAGKDGACFNVNADDVAAAIAVALNAKRLILCSNIPGVLDKNKNKISEITTDRVAGLIADETIKGGMIPKINAAAEVADNPNVGGVVILDGANPKAIADELLTENGAGTLIRKLTASEATAAPDLGSAFKSVSGGNIASRWMAKIGSAFSHLRPGL